MDFSETIWLMDLFPIVYNGNNFNLIFLTVLTAEYKKYFILRTHGSLNMHDSSVW